MYMLVSSITQLIKLKFLMCFFFFFNLSLFLLLMRVWLWRFGPWLLGRRQKRLQLEAVMHLSICGMIQLLWIKRKLFVNRSVMSSIFWVLFSYTLWIFFRCIWKKKACFSSNILFYIMIIVEIFRSLQCMLYMLLALTLDLLWDNLLSLFLNMENIFWSKKWWAEPRCCLAP